MTNLYSNKIHSKYKKDIIFANLKNLDLESIEVYFYNGPQFKSVNNYYSNVSLKEIENRIKQKYREKKENITNNQNICYKNYNNNIIIPDDIIQLVFNSNDKIFSFMMDGFYSYKNINPNDDVIQLNCKYKRSKSFKIILDIMEKSKIEKTELYQCYIPIKIIENMMKP